jgi:hypothetical protein
MAVASESEEAINQLHGLGEIAIVKVFSYSS